ncbi:hypothetical protein BV22DRAFT_1131315 [Leucogyrophana mollusca]|uniref:Uncharacterized protein n=1 Tax=Leucogyrophana mollusca TaxID=85980 RepID=A0ACB8BC71_9AGAM|nr:hypothetical protein BV22DRAFT_1131315 [Leucogyrophana mollusca]
MPDRRATLLIDDSVGFRPIVLDDQLDDRTGAATKAPSYNPHKDILARAWSSTNGASRLSMRQIPTPTPLPSPPPALGGFNINGTQSFNNAPGSFDSFAEINSFTLKTPDAYWMQLLGETAAWH